MATGTGSPCGACKFLRRKCASDCIFAPYFCSEHGPARFAAIHKVFGASNVSKLLLHVPVEDRTDAVFTIAYEAQARLRDPVYGCVSHIFALQQQVASLQAQLMQAKAQLLANNLIEVGNLGNQWTGGNVVGSAESNSRHYYMNTLSPQSSLESIDQTNDQIVMQETQSGKTIMPFQTCARKRGPQIELNELQALAFRMMNS